MCCLYILLLIVVCYQETIPPVCEWPGIDYICGELEK